MSHAARLPAAEQQEIDASRHQMLHEIVKMIGSITRMTGQRHRRQHKMGVGDLEAIDREGRPFNLMPEGRALTELL